MSGQVKSITCLSERVDDWARRVSRRLELALGYQVYDPTYRFTSDNYQIMNYGYGGTISLHKDASTHISDIGIGIFHVLSCTVQGYDPILKKIYLLLVFLVM